MRLLCQTNFQILIGFILATFMCCTGCKSQPGFPSLADLAWWKKDDVRLAETPPPAAHFDPEPAIQMADNDTLPNDPNADIEAVVDAAPIVANKKRYSLDGQPPTHPIRTPYSFESAVKSKKPASDSEPGSDSTSASDNSFASSAGQIKTKLPDWDSSDTTAKATDLSDARESADYSPEQTKSKIASSKTTLDSTNASSASSGGTWKTDFALPANSSTGLDTSFDAARKSLNRTTENAVNDSGSFAQRLQNSIDRAAETITQPTEKSSPSTEQIAQAKEIELNPPIQGFEPFRAEQQAAPNTHSDKNPQLGSEGPSNVDQMKVAARRFQDNADHLQQLADQARQQAEELRRQAASSSTPSESDEFGRAANSNQLAFPATALSRFQPRVAQVTGTPQLPANSLRNSMDSRQDSTRAPLTPPASTHDKDNEEGDYPSTPHNNYAPKSSFSQFNPGNSGFDSSQVSFQGPTNSSNGVVTAGGSGQLSPISAQGDSRPSFSNNDVIVPDAIIYGSGNFAPGSVNQLMPAGK